MLKIRLFTVILSLATYLPAIALAKAGYLLPATIIYAQSSNPPALVVSSPQENTMILGSRVTVDTVVGSIILTNPDRVTTAKSGQGHLHLWLDQPTATRDNAIDYYGNEPVTFTDVPAGDHTLVAEVVQNDHLSFNPQVTQIVHFKTELPKEVATSTSIFPTHTQPTAATQVLPSLVIPLLVGLILVNGGFLWLLVTRKK